MLWRLSQRCYVRDFHCESMTIWIQTQYNCFAEQIHGDGKEQLVDFYKHYSTTGVGNIWHAGMILGFLGFKVSSSHELTLKVHGKNANGSVTTGLVKICQDMICFEQLGELTLEYKYCRIRLPINSNLGYATFPIHRQQLSSSLYISLEAPTAQRYGQFCIISSDHVTLKIILTWHNMIFCFAPCMTAVKMDIKYHRTRMGPYELHKFLM